MAWQWRLGPSGGARRGRGLAMINIEVPTFGKPQSGAKKIKRYNEVEQGRLPASDFGIGDGTKDGECHTRSSAL